MADVSTIESPQWFYDLASCLGADRYGKFVGAAKCKYVTEHLPVSAALIAAHLSGAQPIALPILAEPDKGRVIVADFDDHDEVLPPGEMDEVVCEFAEALTRLGVRHLIFRSGSGTGYHIWIVLSWAVRKDTLRARVKKYLERYNSDKPELALSEGTKGVAGNEVEFFPKGDGKGAGGLIALPLARQSVRVMPTRFTVGGGWKLEPWPEPIEALPLNVPEKSGPKSKAGSKPKPDRDSAFEAYVSTLDPNDYDHWSKSIIPHMQAAFPDDPWARERWTRWSKTAEKPASDQALEAKWQSFEINRVSPITFWLTARDRGYCGHLPVSKREERKAELDQLADQLELLHGDDGIAYAKVAGLPIAMPVESQAARDWLRLAARDAGGSIKKEEVNELVETAGAIARSKPRTEIALRFARRGDKIYLCHADDEQNVTEIDTLGWRPCVDPPVVFRRGRGEPLRLPVEAEPDVLLEMLNLDRESAPFAFAWALNGLLHPGRPSPILLIGGDPGTGKSTVTKALVDMLDPAIGSQAGPPKSEDDLVAAAHGNALLPFDNAQTVNHLSDPLCRLSTGGGIVKRKLYTDADLFALDLCRPVVINGVDTLVNEQDLIARAVKLTLRRPSSGYGSNSRFTDTVNARLPELTGAMLGLASKVLGMIREVEIDAGDLRFHDFTRIGECVARLLGFAPGWFVQAYRDMLDESGRSTLEGDAVARFVITFCNTQPTGKLHTEASATDLLSRMVEFADQKIITVSPKDMPPNPRSFASRLNRAKADLERFVGIRVSEGRRTSHAKSIRLEWEGVDMAAVEQYLSGSVPI